jgi:manganese/zinc/iron transport system permease protein
MSAFWSDPNVQMVVLGVMLLGAGAGVTGVFTFVRKRALVGDAIAHSVLPGVCLAFLISGQKHPLWLLIGAVTTGWLSLLLMDYITRNSKIKADAAIGVVLSVFFGLGILLLTAIQASGSGHQAGLDKFLFGKAASLTRQDVLVFGAAAGLILTVTALFFRAFSALSFDREFAMAVGLPVRTLEFILATITVLAVATGIQAVGVVLMAALLITPAAAARFWTNNLVKMTVLSAIFGMGAGLFGAWISYQAPAMPTGPWIVILLTLIALVSVFAAPERGILARWQLHRNNEHKMLLENILKTFFQMEELQGEQSFSPQAIRQKGHFREKELKKGLRKLLRKGMLVKPDPAGHWRLSPDGIAESRRVVRLHRLWELYLSHKLGMAADHVHDSAEAIEHLLTPEMEKRLLEELEYPTLDPHDSKIPYDHLAKPQ